MMKIQSRFFIEDFNKKLNTKRKPHHPDGVFFVLVS